MEFHEKLTELRKQKGLTQEELAQSLYVTRTAISKWESGRGYPQIDSLRAIACFFGITIDELLSSNELLTLAEETGKQKERHLRDLVFGLLDVSGLLLFFLPFFGQINGNIIQSVSLLGFTDVSPWLKTIYLVLTTLIVLCGIATLTLQRCHSPLWERCKSVLSAVLNVVAVLLFIVGSQPYAAVLLFVFLLIKAFSFLKPQ